MSFTQPFRFFDAFRSGDAERSVTPEKPDRVQRTGQRLNGLVEMITVWVSGIPLAVMLIEITSFIKLYERLVVRKCKKAIVDL
jgi:hypothetical protein